MMQVNPTTPQQGPPLIWEYNNVASEELVSLALTISFRANLAENPELAALLIRLLAAVTAECGECEGCHVWLATFLVMNVFFRDTDRANHALFTYLVHDLKAARPHKREGGEQ